jgi:hypothetical protein
MIYDFLTEALAPTETGSIAAGGKREVTAKSQNTLLPTDLAPAWRGPLPRPDPRGKHSA